MAGLEVKIEGLDAAATKLYRLGKAGRKILQKAMTKACRVVVKAVKANVPAPMKHVRRSLGSKVRAYPSGNVAGMIGALKGKGETVTRPDGSVVYEDLFFILHLIENGRKEVIASKSKVLTNAEKSAGVQLYFGKKVKAVPGLHMLAKGWAASKAQAAEVFAAEVAAGLEKV